LTQPIKPGYAFGEFCLDVSERRLQRTGVDVSLPPKVFDTLVLLVENSGHLLEKDEFMRRLWPDTFVGEDALARNISTLRRSLGEGGDSQALIETVPTRGYRFVATVRQISPAERPRIEVPVGRQALRESSPAHASHEPGGDVIPHGSRPWRRRAAFVIIALAAGSVAGLVTFWLLSPVPVPRVRRITQITHSGRVDIALPMASDGSRLYFLERYGDHWDLMQTSLSGGEAQRVAAPFRNTLVLDVSPDRTNLLVGSFSRLNEHMPLWIWPVQGGAPKRVGDITAYFAIWCPDGRQILYTEDDGIYQADADGANARMFAPTQGTPGSPRWSPDGRRLRFSVYPHQVWGAALWEINSDGTNLHRMLPGWDKRPEEWEGSWTTDGRYFLFDSKYSGTHDVWAMREGKGWFRRQPAKPARLTEGSVEFGAMLPGKSSQQLFAVGATWKNEFVRYDVQSHQFQPFLPDLHAITLSYSRDGAWFAYVHPESGVIARMKTDGTHALDLTPPRIRAWDPRWSPDGGQIAFTGLTEKGMDKIFLVSADGGISKELLADNGNQDEASWSADGKLLAFVSSKEYSASGQASHFIQVLNLATKQLSTLPGSRDMRAPTWSPDGHFLATASWDLHQLMLLDLHSQKWTKLAEGMMLGGGPFAWSQDSKYVYCQDLLAPNEPVYRIRLRDHKLELVTSFETLLRGGVQRAGVVGLTADGSLIAVLTRNSADIYSLDLDLP